MSDRSRSERRSPGRCKWERMKCVLLHGLVPVADRRLKVLAESALGRISSAQDLCFCSAHSFVGRSVDTKLCHSDSKVMYMGAICSKPDA